MEQPTADLAPARPRRFAWWWLPASLLSPMLLALLVTVMVMSEAGQRWLWQQAAWASGGRIVVVAPSGQMQREFAAERILLAGDDASLELIGVASRVDAGTRWWQRDVRVGRLHADTVVLTLHPRADAAPTPVPRDLALPFTLAVERIEIGRLEVRVTDKGGESAWPAVSDIVASLDLGAREHRFALQRAALERLAVSGEAQVGAAAPMPVRGQWQATSRVSLVDGGDATEVSVRLMLGGTLAAIEVDGRLEAREQSARLRSVVTPFAASPMSALDATLTHFNAAALLARLPRTDVSGTARVATAQAPYRIDVDLSNALPGRWADGRVPLARVVARAAGEDSRWRLEHISAALAVGSEAAGEMRASGEWQRGVWRLEGVLSAVRPDLLAGSGVPSASLGGTVRLRGEGGVGREPLDIDWQLRADPPAAGRAVAAPVLPALASGATLEGRARYGGDRVQIEPLKLTAGAARATARASFERAGDRWDATAQVDWSGLDVAPWLPSASVAARDAASALPTALSGQAALGGRWRGTSETIDALHADVTLSGGRWRAGPLRGHVNARLLAPWQPGGALPRMASDGRLDTSAATLNWQGALGDERDRLEWTLAAPALNALLPDAAGAASGSGVVTGAWSALATQFTLRLDEASLGGWRAAAVRASGNLSLRADAPLRVDLAVERLRRPEGANGTQARQTEIDAKASLRGTLARHDIDATLAAAHQGRRFETVIATRGALAMQGTTPTQWLAHSDAVRVIERPAATAAQSTWLRIEPLAWRWQRHGDQGVWTIEPGRASVADVPVAWSRIVLGATDAPAVTGTLGPARVSELAGRFGRDDVHGDLRLGGRFTLRLAGTPAGELTLERTDGDVRSGPEEEAPSAGLRQLQFTLSRSSLAWRANLVVDGDRVGRSTVELEATPAAGTWLPSPETPIGGQLRLDVRNMASWNGLMPTAWRLGGALSGAARIAGTLGAPTARGELRASEVSLANVLEGVDIRQGRARVVLADDRVELREFVAQAGEGSLSVTGTGTLTSPLRLNARATLDRFAAVRRADRSFVLSGQLDLDATPQSVAIAGEVRVDRGRIDISRLDAPRLSDDVIVVRRSAPPAERGPRVAGPRLDLRVRLGNDVVLYGQGLETRLEGELRLTGSGGDLAARGAIRTGGGSYRAYGQWLTIERGIVSFDGPIERPQLDILALKPNFGDQVGVAISGSTQAPRVRLYSNPPRSDTDALALLMLGNPFDELGRDETALVQQAALALLAGEDGNVARKFGLDTLSLRQDASAGGVRQTIVSVGKQLSERLYVGYEQGMASTLGTVELIYRLSPRLTLRAQAGQDTAIDGIFTLRWK